MEKVLGGNTKLFKRDAEVINENFDTVAAASHVGVTADAAEINKLDGMTSSQAELNILTGVTATAAEINQAADVSAMDQLMAVSGAVTAGKKSVRLNHATVAIAATIASTANHYGLFHIKAVLEPGAGQNHTCTITTGTWNGTNKIATFADINDALLVFFGADGNGEIVLNTGAVAFSG
jgi:hypothetical protein